MSHDILSLEGDYSSFVFVKEGKENCNTQYYRIATLLESQEMKIAVQIESEPTYCEKIKSGQKHIVPATLSRLFSTKISQKDAAIQQPYHT